MKRSKASQELLRDSRYQLRCARAREKEMLNELDSHIASELNAESKFRENMTEPNAMFLLSMRDGRGYRLKRFYDARKARLRCQNEHDRRAVHKEW